MLNGIGGRTVAEAKERMSYDEARAWEAYARKRGTLHVGMRLEYGFALIAMSINRALGGKATLHDFMPHVEQEPAGIADVMNLLSGKGNG